MKQQLVRPSETHTITTLGRRAGQAFHVASVVLGWTLGFALVATPALATSIVLLDDAVLADRADLIVKGQVLSVDPDAGVDRPITRYQVQIEEVVKGSPAGSLIQLDVPVGRTSAGVELLLFGAPAFQEGGEALLFLRAEEGGHYRVVEFLQGAFHVIEAEGRRFALRNLDDVQVLALHDRAPEADPVRDLESFTGWLSDRESGVEGARSYTVLDPPTVLTSRFSFITVQGDRVRWRNFDSGGSVRFKAMASGQPGLAGGGFTQFQTALGAWTNDGATPVRYLYGGTESTALGGLSGNSGDGVNTILFDDPNNNSTFDAPFSCSQGGTLAIGGPWVSLGPTHQQPFNGIAHREIVEADIVTNKGINCWIPAAGRPEELFGHELGHTLGLGHTGTNQALMRATAHGDGRGAALHSDDRAGLCQLYCLTASGGGPTAPSNLTFQILSSPLAVRLFWNDNSGNETGFEIERRPAGGSFSRIATTGSNATNFIDDGVDPDATYDYRVRATNGSGDSTYTNQVNVTTPDASGLGAPSSLSAVAKSSSRIDLDWTDNATTETGFEIQMQLGSAQTGGVARAYETVKEVGPNVDSTSITGLDSATSYSFRVRALGTGTELSSFSNVASAATFGDSSPCVENATTHCLNQGRFRVRATWKNFEGETGSGQVVEGSPSTDSGLFWFFNENNWEMMVKVIRACGVNQRFWVFAAATTNVEYTLTVTDTVTGAVRTYFNPLGTDAPALADIEAFATCSASSTAEGEGLVAGLDLANGEALLDTLEVPASQELVPRACTGGAEDLCLNQSRFRLEVDWEDFDGVTGKGQVVDFGSSDSGLFWFFDEDNWEMMVKVLKACGVNGNYWVFSAATTTVEYRLKVTDTETGRTKSYFNPLGNPADALTRIQDFPCE